MVFYLFEKKKETVLCAEPCEIYLFSPLKNLGEIKNARVGAPCTFVRCLCIWVVNSALKMSPVWIRNSRRQTPFLYETNDGHSENYLWMERQTAFFSIHFSLKDTILHLRKNNNNVDVKVTLEAATHAILKVSIVCLPQNPTILIFDIFFSTAHNSEEI